MGKPRIWKKVLENDLNSVVCEVKSHLITPCMVILTGEVGSGKTTFVRSFVHSKNNPDFDVKSPTYSLVNEISDIVHADLYRIESASELVHLELEMYLENKNFFLVEWGKDYIDELKTYISGDFKVYEIEIDKVDLNEESEKTRNYKLNKLD